MNKDKLILVLSIVRKKSKESSPNSMFLAGRAVVVLQSALIRQTFLNSAAKYLKSAADCMSRRRDRKMNTS